MASPALERMRAQTVFSTPLISVGRFEAGPEDPLFREVSPPGHHLAAFPETELAITYERAGRFVVDPTTVTFYNPADHYRRWPISAEGDRCSWVSAPPELLAELVRAAGGAVPRGERIFEAPVRRCSAALFVAQRRLLDRVLQPAVDVLEVEERWLSLLARLFVSSGPEAGQARVVLTPKARCSVAAAQELLAARFRDALGLDEIAHEVGCSAFHLSRAFKARTGLSLHRYRTALRLRHGFDALQAGHSSITDLALELGFSSHSHFSASFRGTFERTPRSVRQASLSRRLRAGRRVRRS